MEFRVLGPLEVSVDGEQLHVPAGRLRVVLAGLLCRANEVVSFDELCRQLWGDEGDGSTSTVRSYVRRLRDVLAGGDPERTFIEHRAPGYLLAAEPSEVDLLRFRELAARAQECEPAEAARLLDEALRLWRGPALADVRSEVLHRDLVPALTEERLLAVERWADVELALGHHARLIGELTTHTARYPLRERFWAQLMLALYRSGRQAEALEKFHTLQRTLAEELGIDPSEEVRRLHQAILTDADVPAGSSPEPVRASDVPHQLAADIREFVGRDDVLDRIVRELSPDSRGTLGLVVISGAPGAGKTALAVRAGHRLRAEFPDGQLFVDLRGYSDGPPVAAEDVLGRFLRALGVAPQRIPADTDEQAALYRSVLTDRRVLVVLDNASSAQQVRTLLPGSPGCAVLVTSRSNLHGLVVTNGARDVRLDVLPERDSLALLHGMLDDRPGAELSALPSLAAACAHLPLALRIAGAQLTMRPQLGIAEYVRELRQGNGLEALTVADDDQTSVRAAFDLSYATLKPEPQRLFRLLGLVPGPDFSAPVAAALSGSAGVQPVLDRLVAANLVVRQDRGRYKLHDLLRAYASDRAARDESADSLQAARFRLYDYYLHTAANADRLLGGTPPSVPLAEPRPDVRPSAFTDYEQGRSWCETERPNLIAIVHDAHRHGFHRHAYTLPIMLRRFFQLNRHLADWIDTHEIGVAAARRGANPLAEAILLLRMANAYQHLLRFDRTLQPLHDALAIAREIGDAVVEATVLNGVGMTHWWTDRPSEAKSYYQQALALYSAVGDEHGETAVLGNLGRIHTHLGDYQDAISCCRRSVELARRSGDPHHQGVSLANLGEAYDASGASEDAIEAYHAAIAMARSCHDRHTEANALLRLGRNRARNADPGAARDHWRAALEIFEETGDPRADEARDHLAALPT